MEKGLNQKTWSKAGGEATAREALQKMKGGVKSRDGQDCSIDYGSSARMMGPSEKAKANRTGQG